MAGREHERYRVAATAPSTFPNCITDATGPSGLRFEAMTSSLLTPQTTTMPAMAQRGGDFSNSVDRSQYQIYDRRRSPGASGRYSRQPFAGNIIPANRIAPIAKQLLEYYPTPNVTVPSTGLTISLIRTCRTDLRRRDGARGPRPFFFAALIRHDHTEVPRSQLRPDWDQGLQLGDGSKAAYHLVG